MLYVSLLPPPWFQPLLKTNGTIWISWNAHQGEVESCNKEHVFKWFEASNSKKGVTCHGFFSTSWVSQGFSNQFGVVFQEVDVEAGVSKNASDPLRPGYLNWSEAPVVSYFWVCPCPEQQSQDDFVVKNGTPAQRSAANIPGISHNQVCFAFTAAVSPGE